MYDKLLVPMALDHGMAQQTLAVARTLCNAGGKILALHVYEPPHASVSSYLDEDAVHEAFDRAKQDLESRVKGIESASAEIVKGRSYRTIIDYAQNHGVDCIVLGSHKPGLSDYLLGTTAARVVRHAPCAVHVCRAS